MRRMLAGLATSALMALPLAAQADYPDKPITVVFPNQAGSTYYTIALSVLHEIEDVVPQPMGIQAMPGAGTATGSRHAIQQPADGYTLLFIHEGVLQVSILGMLGADASEVLEPLAEVVSTSPTIWARADAPYDNLQELAAYAKANPGDIKAAMQTGAPAHVIMAAFAEAIGAGEGIRQVHVGGGGAGARAALLAGDVDLIGDNPTGMAGMSEAGQVKALGVLNNTRDERIPNVATLQEQGFPPNANMGLHGYFWIRADAPQEVKNYWHKVLGDALSNPETVARLEDSLGLDIYYKGGQDLVDEVMGRYQDRARLMEKFGIKPAE